MRYTSMCGNQVSVLGFGCMRLPVIDGDVSNIDEPQATALIHHAIECGVNYLDTAYPYHQGNSEKFLGRALGSGLRDKVYIATKLPVWMVEDLSDCERLLNEQLERLRTDHVDFYALHCVTGPIWPKLEKMGIIKFLQGAMDDGRIGCAGFSFHDDLDVFKQIVDAHEWSFCQIMYNYMDEETQAGTEGLQYAAERGLGVVIMEPLRGGKLAAQLPADLDKRRAAAGINASAAELALRWVYDHPQVGVVLSGMNSMDQLEENLRVAQNALPGTLGEAEQEFIMALRQRHLEKTKVPCTGCGYCMPCPREVDIPKILSIYNELSIYENLMQMQIYYGRAVPRRRQPTNCARCGRCEAHCPQHISIADMLAEVHKILAG